MPLMEHCGPIKYPGMEIEANSIGVFLRKNEGMKPAAKPDPWQASWIWLDREEFSDFQETTDGKSNGLFMGMRLVALFRKDVVLEEEPTEVIAWASGSSKYRFYINGQMAGRGPSEAGGDINFKGPPSWWFYDQYDLTPLFHAGTNTITVEVSMIPEVGADYSLGRGGLLFEARVTDPTGVVTTIVSDGTWNGIVSNAHMIKAMYDAREDAGTWHDASFDHATWPAAQVLPWSLFEPVRLIPREIPPLMEFRYSPTEVIYEEPGRVIDPSNMLSVDAGGTEITPGDPIMFTLNFDREVVGYLQFCIDAPADVHLHFFYQERVGKDDDSDVYISKEGLQSYEAIRLRGFQHNRVTIDFKKNAENDTPVIIHYMGINFTSYPVEYAGEFACSDPLLDQIWKTGRWTNQLCMQNYHLDSPIHQEPLGDTGDYMIESLIEYCCFGDARLARQDLLRTGYLLTQRDSVMFHTSYSLLFVQMLREYHDYTGDTRTVQDLLPAVHALLERFHRYLGESGLITEAPNYMFLDWITVDEFNLHHPPRIIGQGYMTAFYYQALKNAANLCVHCDAVEKARQYQEEALVIRESFNQVLWEPDRGLYCDGRPCTAPITSYTYLPDDPAGRIYFSRQTNALAVAFGIAPDDRRQDVMERVMADASLPPVQPYFMHFMFEALFSAGLFQEHGLSEIRKWQKILDEHPSSWKESWDMGDYSHAWSGTPTYQISTRVLGLAPEKPGFTVTRISPNPGNLTWARGKILTPSGLITVSWQNNPGEFSIEIESPDDNEIIVDFPANNFKQSMITENGIAIWQAGMMLDDAPDIKEISGAEGQVYMKFFGGTRHFAMVDIAESMSF
jgi:alpha-L-rhamnosidase